MSRYIRAFFAAFVCALVAYFFVSVAHAENCVVKIGPSAYATRPCVRSATQAATPSAVTRSASRPAPAPPVATLAECRAARARPSSNMELLRVMGCPYTPSKTGK